jgi:hypothetical protein
MKNPNETHVVAKNDAIWVNISVSLLVVLSKPGVSIVTDLLAGKATIPLGMLINHAVY